MSKRTATRMILVATAAFVATSCAHASGEGAGVGPSAATHVSDAAMCDLRVESAYDVPIQAGVRAGAQEVSLGTLKPHGSVEIRVPCAFGAVTVFRLVERDGLGGGAQLAPRAQALHPDETTTVVVRPVASRSHLRPGR